MYDILLILFNRFLYFSPSCHENTVHLFTTFAWYRRWPCITTDPSNLKALKCKTQMIRHLSSLLESFFGVKTLKHSLSVCPHPPFLIHLHNVFPARQKNPLSMFTNVSSPVVCINVLVTNGPSTYHAVHCTLKCI